MSEQLRRLRSTEERHLRSLLELAPDAMVVVDHTGMIVLTNSQAETLFGYRKQDLLEQHVESLIPKRFRERHPGYRINFFSNPQVRPMGGKLQLFAMRKDGTEFPVEISLSPVDSSEGKLVVSAIRDVTERKMAEESRLRFAAIVESSDDAIISKTLDGTIVSWNNGARQIYGYTEAEAVGKPITILVPPELREEENKILKSLAAGERIEHYEIVRVTKAGKRINVSTTISPIKDTTGTIVGIAGISRDITERKLAEQELANMTRKLVEAQEQERARIARELHDDISQRLALLAVDLDELTDNSEFHNRVQGFRDELRQISDGVRALSHDLHSSTLEYLGVVVGMKSWCQDFAERQQIDVDFRSDARSVLPPDIGQPLYRVLQEALHNAAKHSGSKRVEVRLSEEGGEIHLTIKDFGKGFEIEAAKEGRGLGLTSMQERVRLVNGTIMIESKPMSGTTIHVRVPLESDAQRLG